MTVMDLEQELEDEEEDEMEEDMTVEEKVVQNGEREEEGVKPQIYEPLPAALATTQ